MAVLATTVLHAICAGGPLVVLLYLLTALSIPAAGLVAWRCRHAAASCVVALLPLAFGSMATWLSLYAATIMLKGTGGLSGCALPPAIDTAKQSLLAGWIAASLAFALAAAIRGLRKPSAP